MVAPWLVSEGTGQPALREPVSCPDPRNLKSWGMEGLGTPPNPDLKPGKGANRARELGLPCGRPEDSDRQKVG